MSDGTRGKRKSRLSVESYSSEIDLKTGNMDGRLPQVAASLCTLDDGLPSGLVRPRGWRNAALKAAGNAIVPEVAEELMRIIKAVDAI
jgi:hypothetical protein